VKTQALTQVALALLVPAWAMAANVEPPRVGSPIGYPTVAEALAAMKAKPGVSIGTDGGFTMIEDGTTLWWFAPAGHAAHPSALKWVETEFKEGVAVELRILCEAPPPACDALSREAAERHEPSYVMMQQGVPLPPQPPPPPPNPRDPEVTAFATYWLDLQEQGEADKAYGFLTDIFKSHVTMEIWRSLLADTRAHLGALQNRKLRRIVWYEDPPDAPMPGTYVALEFDSVYEKAPRHFRYVVLHAQGDEPFRVMRDESTVGDLQGGGT
jgi:hypothetical protein